ncbi:MAG: glycerol-3-phosphate dehydrogenase/oxidase [Actinomycetota bacterium]
MKSPGLGSRASALEVLEGTPHSPLDLLVVGGGVTGAGIALDAAARGIKVGLVERADFASGTSSKSSKLVHGGLRYLEQREFGLMREAATERDLLRRLAPHLVEATPFVLPVTNRLRRAQFGVGLWAYDALASFRNLRIHKYLSGPEAMTLVPVLPEGKVRGGFLFYDCKTDDTRLVLELLVQARRYGAVVANYVVARDLSGSEKTCVATVEDATTGRVFEIHARRIVAATGVWTDRLEAMAKEGATPRLRPSKGIHLVFRREALPMADAAAFIPDAQRERMLFVIPWRDAVIVGTTDTPYSGSLDRPTVDEEDRNYCLDALNSVFDLSLTSSDISGAYAGLRPLVAGKAGATADLSRKHAIYEIGPGILGITGGKLTIYRRMAKDLVDRVAADLGAGGRSRTRWIRLGISDVASLRLAVERRGRRLNVPEASIRHLVRSYGERALEVLDAAERNDIRSPLVEGHPELAAEAIYCARSEMVVTLADLLARRCRLALTDRAAGLGRTSKVVRTLRSELGWSRAESTRQVAAYRRELEGERGFPVAETSAPAAHTRAGNPMPDAGEAAGG